MTFDETRPPSKTLPLVDNDLDEEEAIRATKKKNLENDIEDETLEVDEIVNIKEFRNHPLENVIGNLNQRTLRVSTTTQEHANHRTKWVFRNKLDENSVVSQNKARLVAQGYNQQEGIDYDETYAPVARHETIRILLAYACALDFNLFQMDVKSAFLNGFINKEVYVAQPPGFIDFENPDHVYKLKKALYCLKQAPKAWHYALRIMDPKGTGIETVVYADSDHAGDYVDRKSTSEFDNILGSPSKGHCLYSDKWSLDYLEISSPTKGRYQTTPSSLSVIKTLIQTHRQGLVTRVRNKKTINVDDNEILNREIQHHMSSWVEIIRENLFCLGGHRDHVPAYAIESWHERCRSSNPSSSSNVLDNPSSSHHIDEDNDGNDEESFHSNTPSATQLVNSLSNIVPRVFENPPHENQTLHSYQTKILNHQSKHQDEHRKGLRLIGKSLKNVIWSKKK
ncbi:retrovirus-related pol polyprotein from transposon TNT 1-94 [Tanacetum coccineum]